MTYWRRWCSTLLVLVCAGGASTRARTVDEYTAQCAARAWLATHPNPLQTELGQRINAIDFACCPNGAVLYYVVYLEPQGFVIVSPDEDIEPIIAFGHSAGPGLVPGDILNRLISADMRSRLHACAEARADVPPERPLRSPRMRKWQRLVNRPGTLRDTPPQVDTRLEGSVSLTTAQMHDIRVPPLTRSKWGQQAVCSQRTYNYYTPQGLPSGCVATAMAQLMLYHQYPSVGIGVHRFDIWINTVEDRAWTRGGDGQGGPYMWSDMVLNPNCFLTDTERQAIGALCYDAGVAVSTSYEPSGSGAYGIDIAQALTETFLFQNALTGYENENNLTVTADLDHMINPNLDANCPVILGIFGDTGHALVVDGYGYNEETLYYHLNLGFEGAHDVWYNLPNILDYDVVSHCIYNCFPDQSGEIVSGRVTDAYGQPIAGATVTAVSAQGSFVATTNKRGIYALTGIPTPARYRITAHKPRLEFRSRMTKLTASEDMTPITGNRWEVDFRAYAPTDYNRDQRVDLLDFAILARDWRKANSATLSRPELHAIGDADAQVIDAFDFKLFLLDWLVGTDREPAPEAR